MIHKLGAVATVASNDTENFTFCCLRNSPLPANWDDYVYLDDYRPIAGIKLISISHLITNYRRRFGLKALSTNKSSE
jgi:hypothetical protein